MEIKTLKKRNRIITVVMIFIIILFMVCSAATEFNVIKGISSIPKAIKWMAVNFVPNASALSKMPDIVDKLIETILLSIAATTVAGILALIFGVMGSKATRINNFMGTFSRFIASAFRNIPDAVWAMK